MRKKVLLSFILSVMWGLCFYMYSFYYVVSSSPVPVLNLVNIQAFKEKIEEFGQVFPSTGLPWPKPREMIIYDAMVYIDPDIFNFTVSKYSCDILVKALQRYRPPEAYTGRDNGMIKTNLFLQFHLLKSVTIELNKPCESWPYYGMDESYVLSFDELHNALLSSDSIWGMLRGLETFTHLFWRNNNGQLVANRSSIKDSPRFSHRGILLDTSRHYLPVSTIKQNLDLMTMNKMNTFHWHIVDDNSFPFQSQRFPKLSLYGTYDKEMVYTPEDVREIMEHARLRGIRVMPEFDTPGHTLSWGLGYPEIMTQCYDTNNNILPGVLGPINPAKNATFEFLQAFFEEVITIFQESFIHLGGDEVDKSCWSTNPTIKKLMVQKNMNQMKQVQEYYIQRLVKIIKRMKKRKELVVWQEVFEDSETVDPDTIIHVWKPHVPYQNVFKHVTQRNLRAILSSCWYLNYISYGKDWYKYYNCEPLMNLPENKQGLILGGEAAMWGEFVDDTNLIPRLWPRASTVAERLWSHDFMSPMIDVEKRLVEHTCRLKRRGYDVQPVTGPGFCP